MVLGEKSYLAIIFIATHCKFVHVCPWSFGNLSLPWINQQWVPQVVFYIHYTTYFIRINIFNSHLSYLISDFKWKKKISEMKIFLFLLDHFIWDPENNIKRISSMFNVAIDDLAVKPYIPHKSLLQWICCLLLCHVW